MSLTDARPHVLVIDDTQEILDTRRVVDREPLAEPALTERVIEAALDRVWRTACLRHAAGCRVLRYEDADGRCRCTPAGPCAIGWVSRDTRWPSCEIWLDLRTG
jgi:hypothetical protein